MGTSQSHSQDDIPSAPPCSPTKTTKKSEFIIENSFKTLPKFAEINSQGPIMSKAITFDERRMLSTHNRKINHGVDANGPNMRRAVTFVDKVKLQRRRTLSLEDVMYRKHFWQEADTTTPIPPVHRFKFDKALTEVTEQRDEAVVIVDTFSTGAMLAYLCYLRGFRVISAMSGNLADLVDMVPEGLDFSFSGVCSLNSNIESDIAFETLTAELASLKWPIVAIIAGAETGVELADKLSSHFGLRTNGTDQSEARRNKYIMGETIKSAGIRAVKQLQATTWTEIATFLEEWQPDPFKVIVKPMDSAGSDDVTLCLSVSEVQNAFGSILGKVNGLGLVNRSVLVQEYLEGQEYVVDMVSRDGEHKVVAIWEYDRRPANGAPFVCHGQALKIMSDNPEIYEQLVTYMRKVATALGIKNGPSHGEVKWFKGEPVLVEVGSRCHGGDGLWVDVANECVGFTQADATVNVFCGNDCDFETIPSEISNRESYGALKWIVSYQEGRVKRYNDMAMREITHMASYRGHQFFVKPKDVLKKTENCFSWGGCIKLAHANEEQLNRDYDRIAELEQIGLFVTESTEIPVVQYAAVVDPFSTGASLAAEFTQRGIKVIAIYSAEIEKLDNLQNLVPEGLNLSFEAIIGYNDDIEVMASNIRKINENIVAIIPGAETGVELADKLSSHFGLRTNGTDQSEARRNKYIMGETIKSAGIRAVKQLQATTWTEIATFLEEWQPDPFKVIVKPMDSAGSDDVTLCLSVSEVQNAFGSILGKVNGLGLVNRSVLVQEYLEGQEYVVDMVSRDGEHKVVAIWEYDRRPANGAPFVCYGQALKIMSDNPEIYEQLVTYMRKVATALGIKNGPSHGEVKWFKGEPVLVEVGSRCHGAEGSWIPISDSVLRLNQVEATVATYTSTEAFYALPNEPTVRYCDGRLLFLICRTSGTLAEVNINLVEEIRQMKSFVSMEIFLKPGCDVKPTINCFTFGGVVVLINPDEEQLVADYQRIHEMEECNLFVCE